MSESTEKGGLRSDLGYDDGKRRMESLRWTMEEDLATFVSLSLCVSMGYVFMWLQKRNWLAL